MNPTLFRVLGIMFLLTAVILSILNLKRVADLGVGGLAGMCLVFGALFLGLSRRAMRKI